MIYDIQYSCTFIGGRKHYCKWNDPNWHAKLPWMKDVVNLLKFQGFCGRSQAMAFLSVQLCIFVYNYSLKEINYKSNNANNHRVKHLKIQYPTCFFFLNEEIFLQREVSPIVSLFSALCFYHGLRMNVPHWPWADGPWRVLAMLTYNTAATQKGQ